MFVFLSYSHIDKEFIWQVQGVLDAAKIEYFLDQKDVEWGATITEEVEAALEKATHIIILLSPASIKSNWVSYETGIAKGKGLTLLPLLTHPSLDVPTYLAGVNYKSSIDDLLEYFDNQQGEKDNSILVSRNQTASSIFHKEVKGAQYSTIDCPFCSHFRVYLRGAATCPVCNGTRKIRRKMPFSECPRCEGEGYKDGEDDGFSEDYSDTRPCYVCKGTGVVSDEQLRVY